MNLNMQKLFDSLRDGVAIVSPECIVRYTNRIAGQSLGLVSGESLPAENICHQIRAVAHGYVRLPITLEVDAPGQQRQVDRLRVTLLQSPVGSDYLIVVHNLTEAQFYENTVRNVAEMTHQELGLPLQGLVRSLEQLQEQLGHMPAPADSDGLSRNGRDRLNTLAEKIIENSAGVLQRFRQLLLLSETFSFAPMVGQDRITPVELVSEALMRARPALAARRIRVSQVGVDEHLPVIYGAKTWLSQALAEYVQFMAAGASRDAELLLNARSGGNFITFHLQNCGLGIPSHLRERAFLPFQQGGEAGEGAGLGLGLALCKRVVELHQGHVHLVENDHEIVELSIELPAGGLTEGQNSAGIEQAQRYAQDLARLMQRASARN